MPFFDALGVGIEAGAAACNVVVGGDVGEVLPPFVVGVKLEVYFGSWLFSLYSGWPLPSGRRD